MITTSTIEAMIAGEIEFKFYFPELIADISKREIINFNRFRFEKESNGVYEYNHFYEEKDLTLSEYYFFSLGKDNICSYNDFLILIKKMVVEYESISFVSFISNETRYFKLGECDNIFSYLFNLFIFCKSKNSFFNLKRYILNIFENNYEWSDGIFKLSMLNNNNRYKLSVLNL